MLSAINPRLAQDLYETGNLMRWVKYWSAYVIVFVIVSVSLW